MANPAFIVFEGGEGSGKSTQAKLLAVRLKRLGFNVVSTHEPGGTILGDKLRRWVKWGRDITLPTELFCFLASRSQLVTRVIRPALDKNSVVVCDRFISSTIAYQGYGRGVDLAMLEVLNDFVTDGLKPDMTVLLDLDAEQGLARKKRRWDSFEREEFTFHQRVREGYLKMAAAEPEKWLVVDGSLPEKQVEDMIWEKIRDFLTHRYGETSRKTRSS